MLLIMSMMLSLSARRAWIEIAVIRRAVWAYYVALRKESVDRNQWIKAQYPGCRLSLSARRAWIEMFLSMGLDGRFKRRSPQGERG